jgi:hypothetical protein
VKNASQPPNQTPDTASNGNGLTRPRANRHFDAKTIAEIARFCAKQLTESEACRLLNVRPQSWFSWKSRHKRAEKFAALLEEFRAGRIKDLIARVEKSADGEGMKQPDWRAAAFLLSVADAKRFSTSGGASVEINAGQTPILIAVGGEEQLRKLIDAYCQPSQPALPEPAKPKQLAAAVDIEAERVEPGA